MLSLRSPFVAKFKRKGTGRPLTKNLFLISDVLALCSAEANESPCRIQCFSPMHEKHWESTAYAVACGVIISEGSSFVDINTCKSTTYYFLYS
eukprot:scaffold2239_cov114-Skeletonema_dohrnii-CCMP3373.AAC.2